MRRWVWGALFSHDPDAENNPPDDDTINGSENDDTLRGTRGDDTINGLGGDDLIRGGEGRDTISGGAGDDELRGWSGEDILHGGEGNDTLNYGLNMDGGVGDDLLRANIGMGATMTGGQGADTFGFANRTADGTFPIAPDNHSVITDFDQTEDQLLIEFPFCFEQFDSYTSVIEVVAHTDGAATTMTGGTGTDSFEVGAGYHPDNPANTTTESYSVVTITDFDPATETLLITEATSDSVIRLEQHGADTWVILTSDKAGYEDYEMRAAVLHGITATDIPPGANTLNTT